MNLLMDHMNKLMDDAEAHMDKLGIPRAKGAMKAATSEAICADLLAALREVEQHHVQQNAEVRRPEEQSYTLRIVRAAIAKAEGRT